MVHVVSYAHSYLLCASQQNHSLALFRALLNRNNERHIYGNQANGGYLTTMKNSLRTPKVPVSISCAVRQLIERDHVSPYIMFDLPMKSTLQSTL